MINVKFKYSISRIEEWKPTFEEMRIHGMKLPEMIPTIAVKNAKEMLLSGMEYFLSLKNEKAVWIDEYDHVADWLSDNKSKGLFMYGKSGNGKSMLGKHVIPAILLRSVGKIVHSYDMSELDTKLSEALSYAFVSLDDVGTESDIVTYGKRRKPFNELIDNSEKYGKLLIVTSNLSREQLSQTYDTRTIDRINGVMRMIPFNHESFRK